MNDRKNRTRVLLNEMEADVKSTVRDNGTAFRHLPESRGGWCRSDVLDASSFDIRIATKNALINCMQARAQRNKLLARGKSSNRTVAQDEGCNARYDPRNEPLYNALEDPSYEPYLDPFWDVRYDDGNDDSYDAFPLEDDEEDDDFVVLENVTELDDDISSW